jgi:hypothetical protein
VFVTKYSLHLPAAEQQRKTRAAIHAMDIPMKLVLAGGHGKQHDAAWNSQLLHPLDRCKTKSIKGHQSMHIWATRYRATSQSRNAQKRAQKRVGVKVTGHTFNVSIRVNFVPIPAQPVVFERRNGENDIKANSTLMTSASSVPFRICDS